MKIFVDPLDMPDFEKVVEVLSQPSPMQQMLQKVKAIPDGDLATIWNALDNYDPSLFYDEGITMDQWVETIYCEMCSRGISTLQNRNINPSEE